MNGGYGDGFSPEVQKIKELAIVGMHTNFKADPIETIGILLDFTAKTGDENYRYVVPAYWAIKDYILLNSKKEEDMARIVEVFVSGSISENEEI
jgi:hypothetical protein